MRTLIRTSPKPIAENYALPSRPRASTWCRRPGCARSRGLVAARDAAGQADRPTGRPGRTRAPLRWRSKHRELRRRDDRGEREAGVSHDVRQTPARDEVRAPGPSAALRSHRPGGAGVRSAFAETTAARPERARSARASRRSLLVEAVAQTTPGDGASISRGTPCCSSRAKRRSDRETVPRSDPPAIDFSHQSATWPILTVTRQPRRRAGVKAETSAPSRAVISLAGGDARTSREAAGCPRP